MCSSGYNWRERNELFASICIFVQFVRFAHRITLTIVLIFEKY